MAKIAELGASKIQLESYKCSIRKVTVTTKWKAPDQEVDQDVEAVVYDNVSKEGKNIYIVASPKGKSVTIKTNRQEGKCKRDDHKRFLISWVEYKKDEKGKEQEIKKYQLTPYCRTESTVNIEGVAINMALAGPVLPFIIPDKYLPVPMRNDERIENERIQKIKSAEIGGFLPALKLLFLPLNTDRKTVTTIKHATCQEGAFQYTITAYPDISHKLEFKFEMKDPNKKKLENPFKKDWYKPTLEFTTTYNGKADQIKLKIDLNKNVEEDKDKGIKADKHEYVYFKYTKDHEVVAEFGSEIIQQLPSLIENVKDLFNTIKRICSHEFINDLLKFDTSKLKADFKPWKWELVPPSVAIGVESKYRTSKDFTEIGKYYNISIACDPLIGITFTLDLLYLILNVVTSGAATGVYLLIKNLKEVLDDIFGEDIKNSPVSADIYLDLAITGKINSSLQFIIDTIKKDDDVKKLSFTPVEGVLEVELKAGASLSVNVFFIATAAVDVSASASSGITVTVGLEYRRKTGEGMVVPVTLYFNGIVVKYTVKASAGLKKTKLTKKTYLGVEKDGQKKLLDKMELCSHVFTFKDKDSAVGSAADGSGGATGKRIQPSNKG